MALVIRRNKAAVSADNVRRIINVPFMTTGNRASYDMYITRFCQIL